MFISVNKSRKREMARCSLKYLIISIFVALLGGIYELFSHDIYSFYMLYAFSFPLLLGALPFLSIAMNKRIIPPASLPVIIYNCGVATLTVGSIFMGVLEIFGTSNKLTVIYWIVGGIFVAVSVILYIVGILKFKHSKKK